MLNYAQLNFTHLNFAHLNFAQLNCAQLNFAQLNFAQLNFAQLNFAQVNFAKEMAQIEKRKQYWRQFREPEEEFEVDVEREEVGAGEDTLTGCEITAAPKSLQEERKDLEYQGAKCPKNSNGYPN